MEDPCLIHACSLQKCLKGNLNWCGTFDTVHKGCSFCRAKLANFSLLTISFEANFNCFSSTFMHLFSVFYTMHPVYFIPYNLSILYHTPCLFYTIIRYQETPTSAHKNRKIPLFGGISRVGWVLLNN